MNNKFYKINLSLRFDTTGQLTDSTPHSLTYSSKENLHCLKMISCPFPFPWANVGNFLNTLRSIFQQNNEKSEETIALFMDSTLDAERTGNG